MNDEHDQIEEEADPRRRRSRICAPRFRCCGGPSKPCRRLFAKTGRPTTRPRSAPSSGRSKGPKSASPT